MFIGYSFIMFVINFYMIYLYTNKYIIHATLSTISICLVQALFKLKAVYTILKK